MKKDKKIDLLTKALHALVVSVQEYQDERENPAPDLTMRRIQYDQLIATKIVAKSTLEKVTGLT